MTGEERARLARDTLMHYFLKGHTKLLETIVTELNEDLPVQEQRFTLQLELREVRGETYTGFPIGVFIPTDAGPNGRRGANLRTFTLGADDKPQ
jgi:hypothetical protein